jgi:hypothetical protein
MQFNLRFTSDMFYVCTIYTRPLSAQAQYSRSCPIVCGLRYNSSLDTWAVVRLTAYKFRPLIFCVFLKSQKSKLHYDWQSASPPWCQAPIWDPRSVFPLLSFIIFRQLRVCWLGRPLWRENGSVICSALTQVQFQVTLRPTVCRTVRLGAGPPVGAMTRF